ncbi:PLASMODESMATA CALLOSE-BINDING PROTEIN 3 like [Actinidia chinensis var. chinensis]|uniref:PLASMODESMATA CALLOSE-BINDING PROTEIN 3 like n=1 Tax=Actinidia chinensis var. chinensis TaxID=1590841 RepID=A0A2R6QQT7_ACTCC|nr:PLASMODESMATA CALLOSE-BINDING PROTEIN 3 like [Actinidia chinensis var. chinensis]
MAVLGVCLVLFLAMTGLSSATYCICKDGVSDSLLQKNIDYACGAGADCSQILKNGGCYNPNTLKDHCNYAVNSYFQKKGQATQSCNFTGTATTTQSISSQSSGCVYPASPSTAGSGTNSSSGNTPSPVFQLGPTGTTTTDSNMASLTLHLNSNTVLLCSLTLTLLLLGHTFFRV